MSPHSSIAHYRIVSKLGEGGMGAVYRALQNNIHSTTGVSSPDGFGVFLGADFVLKCIKGKVYGG